jgi:hypothetical protein
MHVVDGMRRVSAFGFVNAGDVFSGFRLLLHAAHPDGNAELGFAESFQD